MTSLVFLGIAAAVCLLGFTVLWFFNRSPRSIEAHMQEFNRHIQALAPEDGGIEERSGPQRRPRGPAGSGRRSG